MKCERREINNGEWTCDRCEALWCGELAKTDWRPSGCSNLREKIARIIEPHAGWDGLETSVNTKWQQEAYAKADTILALIQSKVWA